MREKICAQALRTRDPEGVKATCQRSSLIQAAVQLTIKCQRQNSVTKSVILGQQSHDLKLCTF